MAINIGQYGWKIRTYKAATIVGKNMGVRDNYDFINSMLHHSLFTNWLQNNGMKTDKADESTRDIICIDFQFGLRSYEEELAHIKEMRKDAKKIEDEAKRDEKLKSIDEIEERIKSRKDLYKKMSKSDVRTYLYTNGAEITYTHLDKKTNEIVEDETILYKMLYRNPSKAKAGSCMFIREELYDKAYEWITMGIGPKLPLENADIVAISAYAPLSTSATECLFQMDVDDVLFVQDQDSFFRTIADIVRAEDYETYEQPADKKQAPVLVTKKKCVVYREETDVKSTLWDGMALIEPSALPPGYETAGMALLRNKFFKACAFKTRIQKFFQDYCAEHGLDYDTFEVTDMFGKKHLARSVKMISTENGTKFKKFSSLMGGSFEAAYEYWKDRVREDGCIWGIVKRDHPSKLGNYQQLSYQMTNSLPVTEDEVYRICQNSVKYVESLKLDNAEFIKYLRKNANVVNSYEMLADLYDWNPAFGNSKFFRVNKRVIINEYVTRLKKGKIVVPGDNLTVCGNPYALLLHAVGEDWATDPTLVPEEGTIQCYTTRFADGEFLCGIRSPQNSSNNIAYYHNIRHPLMAEYFDFSPNIMAINCIQTDAQARLNGMDFDSDFNLVTNQPEMVLAAKRCYEEFPTVVNDIPESGLTYNNTLDEYARMDTAMQGAQKAIGGSSDTAQLALSYYFNNIYRGIGIDNEDTKNYYDAFVILAVLAQCAIDGCKRVYAVNPTDEIKRIRAQKCMNLEKDYPKFMKYTHKVPTTKNGRDRPYEEIKKDRNRVEKRIDDSIVCPMNWMQECLEKIQMTSSTNYTETKEFLEEKPKKHACDSQMRKIRGIVEDLDAFTRKFLSINSFDNEDSFDLLVNKSEEVYQVVSKIKVGFPTMYRLIEAALGYDYGSRKDRKYQQASKYALKTLNVLYRTNKELFMSCFRKAR